jgi:hypothetical protein
MRLYRRGDLTAAAKLTGAAIASHLNFQNGLMCPSMQTVATETSQEERTVRGHVALLNKLGLLGVVRVGRHYRYTLGFDTGMAVPVKPKAKRRSAVNETGTAVSVCNPEKRNGDSFGAAGKAEPQRHETGMAIPPNSGTVIPPNLESNLEQNLSGMAIFIRLRPGLGETTKEWVWRSAVIGPSGQIVFASQEALGAAHKLHGWFFDKAGIKTTSLDEET